MVQNYTFKTLLLGDQEVEKTKTILRVTHGIKRTSHLNTVGMELYSRYETVDAQKVTFSLWDIAGADRFKPTRETFYRNSYAALVFYDVANRKSFHSVEMWIKEARDENPDLLVVLIGVNDNPANQRDIQYGEGIAKARHINAIDYVETISLTGVNIVEALLIIGKELIIRENLKNM